MKSAVETLDATTVKLTVEVSNDELKPSIDHAYEHIGSQVAIPGFRKGKVPRQILDQRVGRAAVIEHAVNDGIPGLYQRAVTEAEIRPIGQPEIEVTELPVLEDPSAGMSFTAQVEILPTLDLPELDSLELTVEDITVTDADVDERLDALRERFATLIGVDRPAADGDFVVLDLRATSGEEEIDAVSGISYRIGSGDLLPGLDEALIGISAGETTTFEAPMAGGQHAGENALVTVTATSVKERELPAADDEFAQLASEFDTLDELVVDLREQAARIKAQTRAVRARDLLVARLQEGLDVPLPARILAEQVDSHLQSEGREDDAEHRAEVEVDARKVLTEQILVDTLVEKLDVQVGQEELLQYLVTTSQQYGMDPNTFIKTVDEQRQIPAMVTEVARSKAVAVALRRVRVVEESGAQVDLSEFIGSDDDAVTVPSTGTTPDQV